MWLVGFVAVALVGLTLVLVGVPFWLVAIWGVVGAVVVVALYD